MGPSQTVESTMALQPFPVYLGQIFSDFVTLIIPHFDIRDHHASSFGTTIPTMTWGASYINRKCDVGAVLP